ncbi:alpha/beta hydrolase [Aquimarina latercula]|uniref:alpha/beta hydrolase n=1 Tax=Aquimarina latercula TaxID=987 RepID=UPI000423777A|nr:alpha/beta hydrolase [Aquimarina latercula]
MKKIIYVFTIALLLVNCNNDDDSVQLEELDIQNALTKIPDDITKLFSAKGNESADTVVIYEQGGPDKELDDEYFELNGSFNTDYNDLFKNYYRVYMHQALTLNNGLCMNEALKKEQADLENKVSIEMLDRVIKNFKSKGKKVYVMGHSFGGFLVTKYIAEKGNTTADKFVIMAARLEMQPEVPDNFLQGNPYYFLNGTTPKEEDRTDILEEYNDIKQSCPSVFSFLGAIGGERFPLKITAGDLSNVIYVFAKDDFQTGGLLTTEKTFLSDRMAKVIEIDTGGHGAMFNSPYPQQVFDLLQQ